MKKKDVIRSENIKKRRFGILYWIQTSVILNFLFKLSDLFYKKLSQSFIGGLFLCYDDENETAEKSFMIHLREKIGFQNKIIKPIKKTFKRTAEQSEILQLFVKIKHCLLTTTSKIYGIFLFSFGLYSLIVYFISVYALKNHDENLITLLVSSALIVASLPAMFGNRTLCVLLCESRLMNFILFTVIGVRREDLNCGDETYGRSNIAFIVGMLLGLATYFIPTILIIAAFAATIFLILLMKIPEFGVVMIFFAIPFLPTMLLVGLTGYTAVCYLFKLIQGKRTFKLDLTDFAVGAFMILILCGGIFSVTPSGSTKSALVFICFMIGYFLTVNLIKTEQWIQRCVAATVTSGFFVALYGVYENYFGLAQTTWQDEEMFENISGRVVSTFGNPNVLAEYLIMIIPMMFAVLLLSKKAGSALMRFGVFGIAALCLVFTWSRGAWLGLLIALLIFMLIYSRKTMLLLFAGIIGIPFIPFLLPQSIVSRFTSIGNMADTSTAYRVNIWRAVVDMIQDFFIGGIGVGGSAFAEVYPVYSLAGIESAPHSHQLYLQIILEIGIFGLLVFLCAMIFFAQSNFSFFAKCSNAGGGYGTERPKLLAAAGFAGIIAVLAQGMTDYIWYNYRIFLMFWMIFGLTQAIRRTTMSVSTALSANRRLYDKNTSDSAVAEIELDIG